MKVVAEAPFSQDRYYVLDGGFSTQLSKYVSGVDQDPLWTARSLVENKEAVVKVHKDFLSAGADIILTCSYQASKELMKEQLGLSREQTFSHIVDSVELAWRAVHETGGVPGHTLVGGSVGPYGACLHDGSEYTGSYLRGDSAVTRDQLRDWHQDRLRALQQGGVSFLALETFPASEEAVAVMDCVAELGLLPVWVSFTLRDSHHLAGGETIAQALRAVTNHQLARDKRLLAVGFNCSAPTVITGALQEARKAVGTKIPFVVYPNSGETWECGHWSKAKQDTSWIEMIPDWIAQGTRIVGGCCRVTDQAMPTIKAQITKALVK